MNESDEDAEHYRRLNVFIGKWTSKGQQYECPFGAAAQITATDSYEWMEGGKFVIHRFNGKVGANAASCIEIMGFDASGQRYRMHTFYNNGMTSEWRATESNGKWVIVNVAGQPMKVRCTSRFSDDRKQIASKWECSKDGNSWQVFWEVQATKLDKERKSDHS